MTKKLLEKLEKKGLTRYAVAKKLGVAHNTVSMWYRNVWKPNAINRKKLEKLVESEDMC